MENKTIFDRILSGEIECEKVYEDEHVFSFKDVNPQAPVHVLVIPKKKIVNVASSTEADIEIMGRLLYASKKIADQLNITDSGYRLIFNNNADAGQTVDHLHCHILGGRPLGWPPG